MWLCKKKKQKCRTGPDCGWNMKPGHCDVFYNCKFNEDKMRLKTEHDFELEKLELQRKELDFKIIELRNRIKAEEMIVELSAAEKYVDKYGFWYGGNRPNGWGKSDLTACHEAGQKHGAGVERERASLLICDIMSVITMLSGKIYSREQIQDILDKAVKNYQRGYTITGPDLELPEKPSWAEPEKSDKGEIIGFSHGYSIDGDDITIHLLVPRNSIIQPGKSYKLTPIKD